MSQENFWFFVSFKILFQPLEPRECGLPDRWFSKEECLQRAYYHRPPGFPIDGVGLKEFRLRFRTSLLILRSKVSIGVRMSPKRHPVPQSKGTSKRESVGCLFDVAWCVLEAFDPLRARWSYSISPRLRSLVWREVPLPPHPAKRDFPLVLHQRQQMKTWASASLHSMRLRGIQAPPRVPKGNNWTRCIWNFE